MSVAMHRESFILLHFIAGLYLWCLVHVTSKHSTEIDCSYELKWSVQMDAQRSEKNRWDLKFLLLVKRSASSFSSSYEVTSYCLCRDLWTAVGLQLPVQERVKGNSFGSQKWLLHGLNSLRTDISFLLASWWVMSVTDIGPHIYFVTITLSHAKV